MIRLFFCPRTCKVAQWEVIDFSRSYCLSNHLIFYYLLSNHNFPKYCSSASLAIDLCLNSDCKFSKALEAMSWEWRIPVF